MRKIVLILLLIFALGRCVQAQQKWSLTAAAASCTTSNASCLIYQIDAASGGATLTVSANPGNTLQFEATGDGGTTWVALNATPSNSTTAASSTTSTGTWQVNVAGYTAVRIRMSTLASGTSTVSIITSIASARSGGGGGGTGTVNPGTTGQIPLYTAAGTTLGPSSLTDNGTVVTGTEPFRLGNGTGSAPSYSFTGFTNSGLIIDGNQALGLVSGGNELFEVLGGQSKAFVGTLQYCGVGASCGIISGPTTGTGLNGYDRNATHPIHNAEVGTCTMTTTTCTFTLSVAYATPLCWALDQTNTGVSGKCTVATTTATVTAGTSNTDTWNVLVMGNPN